MAIADLIAPQSVIPRLRVTGKKQALQELARRAAAQSGVAERLIVEHLIAHERREPGGIGMGIGVLHAELPGLTRLYGIFARLERPIPFEAIDDEPVDLVFVLLSPQDGGPEHLKALAGISRRLRDRAVCEKLRGTEKAEALYALLTDEAAESGA
jgi:PTS system nitrogen regulatory IIA component